MEVLAVEVPSVEVFSVDAPSVDDLSADPTDPAGLASGRSEPRVCFEDAESSRQASATLAGCSMRRYAMQNRLCCIVPPPRGSPGFGLPLEGSFGSAEPCTRSPPRRCCSWPMRLEWNTVPVNHGASFETCSIAPRSSFTLASAIAVMAKVTRAIMVMLATQPASGYPFMPKTLAANPSGRKTMVT